MSKETFGIGILSLTALVLLVANYFTPQHATAGELIKDRDYQVVTAAIRGGDDGLYILDNRTGILTIWAYDIAQRRMVPRAARSIADAFTATR